MRVEEWWELERTRDVKYEYVDGKVYAIPRNSLAHAHIGANTVRAIDDALADKSCYVYNSDASVRLSESRYVYPDASVSCDAGDQPGTRIEIQAPCVVVEVLSDSTEGKDRIKKAHFYQACRSIQEYVLIATKYQAVEVQRRSSEGWTLHIFGPGDDVELVSIDVRIPVSAFYRGTTVPEPPDDL